MADDKVKKKDEVPVEVEIPEPTPVPPTTPTTDTVSVADFEALVRRVTALEDARAVIVRDFNARVNANYSALVSMIKGDPSSAMEILEGFYKRKIRD